jgi:hypothetical protein
MFDIHSVMMMTIVVTLKWDLVALLTIKTARATPMMIFGFH